MDTSMPESDPQGAALTESRTLREHYMGRTDALDKVGALAYLTDDFKATTEMVAAYYEIPLKTLEAAVALHRGELDTDGYDVIDGERLTLLKQVCGIRSRARSVALFPRPAILRMGMLLTGSDIARQVRDYLIKAESGVPAKVTNRQLAEMVLAEADRADAAEAKIVELAPKAAQADHHRAADGLMLVGDFANSLLAWAMREHRVRIKHAQVWDFLADINLLIRGNTVRHNQPTAFATKRDLIRAKYTEYQRSGGELQSSCTPRLTPAGEGWAWDRAVKRIAAHGSLATPTKAIGGASA